MIREETWTSAIPLKLTLAANEVTSHQAPPPVYILAPRHSYLPIIAKQVLQHFQHVLPPGQNTPWFEHNSLPLRWQVPLGVLFDLLVPDHQGPWPLTVHFRSFPTNVLLAWEGDATMRASFYNSMKEAAVIMRGSAAPVMHMTNGAQDELWAALEAGDSERYRVVSDALQLAPASSRGRQPAIPLRVFLRTGPTGYMPSYDAVQYTSRPAEAVTRDAAHPSLLDVLQRVLPHIFLSSKPSSDPSAAPQHPAAPAAASAAPPAAAAPVLPASGSPRDNGATSGDEKPGGAAGLQGPAVGLENTPAAAMDTPLGGGGTAASTTGGAENGEPGGNENDRAGSHATQPAPPAVGRNASSAAATSGVAEQGSGPAKAQHGDGNGMDDSSGGTPIGQAQVAGGAAESGRKQSTGGTNGDGGAGGLGTVAGAEVIVCGIRPPLQAPIAWLHKNMHAADHFLYVVVHARE